MSKPSPDQTIDGQRLLPSPIRDDRLQEVGLSYIFWCPGCKEYHRFLDYSDGRPSHGFNGNFQFPTFYGPLDTKGHRPLDKEGRKCAVETKCLVHLHSGKLVYAGASRHDLRGRCIDLPLLLEAGET